MYFNRYIFIFFLIYFASVFGMDSIDNDFYNELQAGVTEIVSANLLANEKSQKYDKHIEKTTKSQVRKRLFKEAKNSIKNKIYKLNKPLILDSLNERFYIYKSPKIPFYTELFMQKNILQADITFDFVNNSFYLGGQSQDLSNLLFRQNDLTVKDILLVSRLLKEGKVVWHNGDQPADRYNKLNYLYILADQPLLFNASSNKQTISFNFAKHLFDGDFSVGFKIPFSRLSHKIDLTSNISAADREKLRIAHAEPDLVCGHGAPAGPNFFEKYGTLENLLVDILDKKGIAFNKKDKYLGFEDLSLFLNAEIDWHQAERVFTGLNFTIPLSRNRNTSKLWDAELGNGGFYFIEPFVSVLFSKSRWFNPHIFSSLKVGFPAKVNRRIPKLVSYNGVTPPRGLKATNLMIFGDDVFLDGIFTNERDSEARRFSDIVTKVNIIPGPKFFLRIGNVLERFLDRNAFFDFYYDFGLKFKDYIGKNLDSSIYDHSVLTDNSWYYEHRIGGSYTYQIDENFRMNIGLLYGFAGCNVEQIFRVNAGLNFEF